MDEKKLEEKTFKVVPENSIDSQEYDVSEPWVEAVALEKEEVEGISFTYNFNGDEAAEALKIFQKKMIRKRNLIYTCVFLIVEILYLAQLAKNPDYTMGKILAVVCLLAIFYIWYMPWNHIRSIRSGTNAMAELPSFDMTVNEKGLINLDGKGEPFLIPYTEEKMQVIENDSLYVMIISKEKCFIVPKRCLTAQQIEGITAQLKAGLGSRYEYSVKK